MSATPGAPAYTPTERRLMEVLSDMEEHPNTELQTCLYDELASPENLRFHMSNLRKKVMALGMGIYSTRVNGHTKYRLVRLG